MASPQSSDGCRNDGTFKFGDLVWARDGTIKFGDLVWARVGSRYWPGHIFHPSLASKSDRDRQIPSNGRLVSFSDVSYGWYRLNQLLPFEGYFQRMLRQATRDPDLLEKTLGEALNEVWRWAALAVVSLRNAETAPEKSPRRMSVDSSTSERWITCLAATTE